MTDEQRQQCWHYAVVEIAHQIRESDRKLSQTQAFRKARKKFAHLPGRERGRLIEAQFIKHNGGKPKDAE